MAQIGFDKVQTLDQPPRNTGVGEPVVHPSAVAPHLHQVMGAELSQVLGHPWLRDLQGGTQGLHIVLAVPELFDQPDPVAMGDHPEQGGEFVYGKGTYGHGPIITINPQR